MSEFKFVQWGKGTPVDYQRLNAMMLNEQYLKDVVDNLPRGTLAWKTASAVTIDPSGGYQQVTGFTNIVFDVEEDRLTSFEFNPGTMTTDVACQFRIRFVVDGVAVAESGGGGMGTLTGATGYFASSPAVYIPPSALSKGTHSVSVEIIADGAITTLRLGNVGTITLKVEDVGKFISASS